MTGAAAPAGWVAPASPSACSRTGNGRGGCPSCGRSGACAAALPRRRRAVPALRRSTCATLAAASRSSRPCSSSSPSAVRMPIVSRCAEPFLSAMIASRRTASLPSRGELVQQRPHAVDDARVVTREQLEREQRRAAAGRALVLEAAPQQLDLLAEAELRDRAVGDRPLAVVLRARRRLELLVPLERRAASSCSAAFWGEAVGLNRGLGGGSRLGQRVRRARRCSGRTAGSGGRCAAARRCAPTSRRPGRSRTSPGTCRVGSRRSRARRRPRTRRSSPARGRATSRAAPRGPPPRAPRRPRPAASRARAPSGEGRAPAVLGAVDAMAEAHDPLAAVEHVVHVRGGVAARLDLVEHLQHARRRAAVERPGERTDRRRHRRGAVRSRRGSDARGERRGVHPVLGRRHPVGVDRLDVLRVGLAAPADQELGGRVLALLDLDSGTVVPSPRAACATIESAAAESRARSSRACSGSMSTSCFRPHFGPSVARPAWRSAITEPLGSCSSIRSACGMPGSKLSSTSSPHTCSNGYWPTSSSMSTPR